ncbi:ClpXP protease specificity-enhancing factor [Uliginosibacterium sp. H1]|uniref:ClpXP protease specificity-enhancing factor n=1 Tax=Uliginosibacterium sp. H1 TaxID=3114757 RepID=UPI002E19BCFD|nr:ClpXP protease specificity-enhancing factor [Uliginosibacterium sp. H1]
MSAPASSKPYLIRAIFDWCVDNGFTPHVVVIVDTTTRVPNAYVKDGQIVLNIAPYATNGLTISNDDITCQARFGGVAHSLFVPISNVVAIYARENGQGMAFELGNAAGSGGIELDGSSEASPQQVELDSPAAGEDGDADDKPPTPPARGHLRVIK